MGQIIRANPSSTLTRPNNATAYVQNQLIASNTTAGSIVVPSIIIPRDDARSVSITRGRIFTNKVLATLQLHVDLWSAAPTFTNGDGGAYAVATGWANWIGHLTSAAADVYSASGDGTMLALTPGSTYAAAGSIPLISDHSPGGKIFWTLREIDATGFTPSALEIFTLTLELEQDLD